MSHSTIVILGITANGTKFRPSDWAERLYHAAATYGPDRRAVFPPFMKLVMREGAKCIEVDRRMEDSNALLFDFLIGFARDNDLCLVDEDGSPLSGID
jgi:hypothetical protein